MAQKSVALSSELRFTNKAEWLNFLKKYQECQNHQFTPINTKYLHQANLKYNYNSDLELYSADYKCHKHGIYVPKGKGKKKSTSAKTNCLAEIKLRLTPCRQYLYIKSFNEQHNHPEMGVSDRDNITAENVVSALEEVNDTSDDTAVSPNQNLLNQPKNQHNKDFLTAGPLEIIDDVEENQQPDTTEARALEDFRNIEENSSNTVEIEKEVMKLALVSDSCRIVSLKRDGRSHTAVSSCLSVTDIVLPKKVESKGRPPGRATTAIGLPIRKNQKVASFDDKTPIQKVRTLLQLILRTEQLTNVICGEYLIQEDDVSMDVMKVPDSFTHESVDINTLEIYFEKSAFKKFRKSINLKKKKKIYVCRTCQIELTTGSSCVLCDSCLSWYHFECDTYDKKKITNELVL